MSAAPPSSPSPASRSVISSGTAVFCSHSIDTFCFTRSTSACGSGCWEPSSSVRSSGSQERCSPISRSDPCGRTDPRTPSRWEVETVRGVSPLFQDPKRGVHDAHGAPRAPRAPESEAREHLHVVPGVRESVPSRAHALGEIMDKRGDAEPVRGHVSVFRVGIPAGQDAQRTPRRKYAAQIGIDRVPRVGPDVRVPATEKDGPEGTLGKRQRVAKSAPVEWFGPSDWKGFGHPLPFPEGAFGTVLFSCGDPYIRPDARDAVYADLRRVLAPGGTLGILTRGYPDPEHRHVPSYWLRVTALIHDFTESVCAGWKGFSDVGENLLILSDVGESFPSRTHTLGEIMDERGDAEPVRGHVSVLRIGVPAVSYTHL